MSIRALDRGLSPTPPPPTTAIRWSCTGPTQAEPAVSSRSGSRMPGIGEKTLFLRFQKPGTRPSSDEPYPAFAPE